MHLQSPSIRLYTTLTGLRQQCNGLRSHNPGSPIRRTSVSLVGLKESALLTHAQLFPPIVLMGIAVSNFPCSR